MDIVFGKSFEIMERKEIELQQFYLKHKFTGEKYGDQYGSSTAINANGNIIIVGDPDYRIPNSTPNWALGKIEIFTGNYIDGWQLKQRIIESGANYLNKNYNFGYSVATNYDGSVIVNGGPGYHLVSGGAMILTGNMQDGWGYKQFITGSSTFSTFGRSVATNSNGNVIAVGSPYFNANENISAGEVMIFTGNSANGWAFKQSFTGNKPYQVFGASLAIDSGANTIIVGSPWNGLSRSGCVSIFTGNSQAGWSLKQEIFGNSSFDYFGTSVAANNNGSVIAIGAPSDESFILDAGSVNIFTGNNINGWQLKQKTFGNSFFDNLGVNIAINKDGTVIAVGESYDNPNEASDAGSVMVLTGNAISGWLIKQTITGNVENARFGYSVSIDKDANTIVMGGPKDNTIPASGGGIISVGAVMIHTNKSTENLYKNIHFISTDQDYRINFLNI